MLKIVTAVISRDLKLAMRRQADIVSALFFFIIVVSLFDRPPSQETQDFVESVRYPEMERW